MASFWKTWTGFDDELVERMRHTEMRPGPPHRRLDLVVTDKIAADEQSKAAAIRLAWQRAVDRVNTRRPGAVAVEIEDNGSLEKHAR